MRNELSDNDLRYRKEVDVVKHHVVLRVFSAKDYHKHGVCRPICLRGVDVSWSEILLQVLDHISGCWLIEVSCVSISRLRVIANI